jgi:hypothetical protein
VALDVIVSVVVVVVVAIFAPLALVYFVVNECSIVSQFYRSPILATTKVVDRYSTCQKKSNKY